MLRWHVLKFVIVLSVLGGIAQSAAAADLSACIHPNAGPQAGIAACTSAISSGSLDQNSMAAARFTRSSYETTLKEYGRALADCDAVTALRPQDFQGYDCHGFVHVEMGKIDLAIADYGHALLLNPQDYAGFYNRARALALKNDLASAIPDYDSAIRIDPRKFMAWNGRCWARIVIGKDREGALSDCNEAIRLAPDDANNYNSRGFVHFRMKQYTAAISDYDAAIARDPNVASSYYIRGLSKLALGAASGNADIAKGKSIEPEIAKRFSGYGVTTAR